ncbi:serine/threonine-protein kinase H1-like [Stylophora pistillata]|uniref:Serine/threonine-protein kinase H1 n=1 Tax=Stylophora pistillata TaxID=50429 RepID=A0A2B4RHY6_STYPI|nr:serine/threonine-protein kinase H1-like [Stylophora pistillata]PFX16796.1 Serine/threonine-protein kinase H1 [Stylophora pistillata]
MGCNHSKKLDDVDCVKTSKLNEASREVGCKELVNNEKGKNSEKKPKRGRVLEGKLSFDAVVTEKYEIKALIGRGSFSRVVRVEHKETKQPYAIKMLKVRGGKNGFESEVAVLRKVKHDYIVQLYEVFECPERIYLVMELATGGELLDRIVCRGSFTEHDATRVLIMVLEGVSYLHSLGITHRDLKPENLLYYHPGNDSKIMITDFGFSSAFQNSDSATMDTICGTPEYIAPEILKRQPYTNAVDMWAIGVITHILLSGEMPFSDENRTRMYHAILKAKYSYITEAWKDVSEQAKNFIDKLLVVDPGKRMTADQALRDPWIALSVASSSLKDLHRSFSQNWLKSSSRLNSAKSNASQNWVKSGSRMSSAKSNASQNSTRSLRSGRCKQKNSSPLPLDTTAQSDEFKQGGTKSKDLKDLNVKLTKQLAEKLHSVINEDDREFFNSTTTENECEVAVLKVTREWTGNRQHGVRGDPDTNIQTIDSSWNVKSKTDNSSPLQHPLTHETSNEKAKTKPIPIVRDGAQLSHLVMRDNFLGGQSAPETSQNWFQDSIRRTSYAGESLTKFHSLSPSRKNRVFCTYDSS